MSEFEGKTEQMAGASVTLAPTICSVLPSNSDITFNQGGPPPASADANAGPDSPSHSIRGVDRRCGSLPPLLNWRAFGRFFGCLGWYCSNLSPTLWYPAGERMIDFVPCVAVVYRLA